MIAGLFTEASPYAGTVDRIFLLLSGVSLIILGLVVGLIIVFVSRYYRGSPARRGLLPTLMQHEFEIGWTTATLFLFIFLFWFGVARVLSSPVDTDRHLEIHIYAKQWMWKAEHPNGAREINTLHLPVNTPVHLMMTSQDVIHSFFVPEFRAKHDVLPDRITQLFLFPNKIGTYHLFCAEYCGTEHSQMTGSVIVMSESDYAKWQTAQPHSDSLAGEGSALFSALGCSGCHAPSSAVHAPDLHGIYGRTIPLSDGRMVMADEAYIRDSILLPKKDVVAGFAPIMPSFSGIVDDSQITRLIAYIKSLAQDGSTP